MATQGEPLRAQAPQSHGYVAKAVIQGQDLEWDGREILLLVAPTDTRILVCKRMGEAQNYVIHSSEGALSRASG